MKLTDEKALAWGAKAINNYEFFIAGMFAHIEGGAHYIFNPFHYQIIDRLNAAADKQINRLLINMPPGYGKTLLTMIYWDAWCFARNPKSRFIQLSYSQDLAEKNSRMVKAIMRSELYLKAFGDLIGSKDTDREWETTQGGGFYASTPDGQVIGYRAGRGDQEFSGALQIDDPIKDTDALSKIKREKINQSLLAKIKSRPYDQNTPVIMIMQRLATDDPSGFFLQQHDLKGDGENWEHLKIPIISNNKPIWPEKHDIEWINRTKESNPFIYNGQYMQEPTPLGGSVFKNDWWRYYDDPGIIDRSVIIADTAMIKGDHNDFTVFQWWGIGRDKKIKLLDQLRGKWDSPEMINKAEAFFKKCSVGDKLIDGCSAFYIEKAANGIMLFDFLKQRGIPVRFLTTKGKDKFSRAQTVTPSIESGLVELPRNAKWLMEFLSECESFRADMAHQYDDQVDCLMYAVETLLLGRGKFWDRL